MGELRSAPAVSDGLVYAAGNLGDLYIFDARTGQDKLRYRASGNTKGSPAVANGLAYFPAGGRIYAVDADAREVAGEYQFNRVWAQFYYWQIPGVPRPPVQKGGQWLFDPDFNPRERSTTGLVAGPAVTPGELRPWRFTADGSSSNRRGEIPLRPAPLGSSPSRSPRCLRENRFYVHHRRRPARQSKTGFGAMSNHDAHSLGIKGDDMASIEERVSRLEGGAEHLATKADVAEVKGEIASKAEVKGGQR